jgi:hypothetical protein
MSERGDIMDAIITGLASVVTDLTASLSERGLKQGEDLIAEDFPHLFVYNPVTAVESFGHGQKRRAVSILADLWLKDQTQEEGELELDAIQALVNTDPTFGGVCDLLELVANRHVEHPTNPLRIIQMEFVATTLFERVISIVVGCHVVITPGVSVATLLTNAATAISTALSSMTRASSDWLDVTTIPVGASRYQMRAIAGGETSLQSNIAKTTCAFQVAVHHKMGGSETERQYTEDEMQTYAVALLDPDTWTGITGVFEILEDGKPSIEFPGDVNAGGT